MVGWHLNLLGETRLVAQGAQQRLERKTAALLGYLALQGPTPRSTLAGMLWPESGEEGARANLRQCLRRLRGALGMDIVAPDDTLRLLPDCDVDVLRLEAFVFTGEYAQAIQLEGELLGGFGFDDLPDLEEWVLAARERMESARREALTSEVNRFERQGEFGPALELALRLLGRDDIAEDAHRRVMRLHYLQGDRPSAIRAFERCRDTLRRELKLEPLPETLELARLIQRGAQLPKTVPAGRLSIPLSILRPPVLVGRNREWQALEAAWEARKMVFVVGDAGMGKTRLMLDFVGSKGEFVLNGGRPGDAQIPYSTFSRGLRAALSETRQPARLPPSWIRRELLRLVPEKAASFGLELPPPIGSRDELLRFFEAITEFTRLDPHRWAAFVSDDLQFYDTASFELRMYMAQRLTDHRGQLIRSLAAYRRGALNPAIQALIEQMLASEQAVLIDLGTLEPQAIQTFMTELQLPGLEHLSPAMSQYTGGNPMYVLETLKYLIETDRLQEGLPEHLPPPGRIGPLVRQRLERLSPGALRLARVAAVTGTDFRLELATRVLETNAMDLAEPLAELESAQVMRGERFAHDLIFEATLEGVPVPIRTLIHRRSAEHLETIQAEPVRIAHHWLEAGDEEKAVPWLLAAATVAQTAYRRIEAVDWLEQAARVLEAHGEASRAFDVIERLVRLLMEFDTGQRHEAFLERMLALASSPAELARAWNEKAELLTVLGRLDELAQATEAGLEAALRTGDPVLIGQLLEKKAFVLEDQGRLEESMVVYQEEQSLLENTDRYEDLAALYNNMAIVLAKLGRSGEAITALDRAAELHPDEVTKIRIRHNKAMNLAECGLVRDALEILENALLGLSQHPAETRVRLLTLITTGYVYRLLARYSESFTQLDAAARLDADFQHWRKGDLYRALAANYVELGAFERAELEIERAIHESRLPPGPLGMAWLLEARILHRLNAPFDGVLRRAEDLIRSANSQQQLAHLHFAQVELLEPAEGLLIVQNELERLAENQANGVHIAAHTRAAQALLGLKRPREAHRHSAEAVLLLERFDSAHLPRTEVLLTHYRALEAIGDANARMQLETTLAWVLEIADRHVPSEHRASFLERNPINRAILEAARDHGLPMI